MLKNFKVIEVISQKSRALLTFYQGRLKFNHHTAADDRDFFEPFERSRDAERADEVENGVAGFELREVFRRFADRLNDDRNAAFFAVVIGDGEGDAFAELVDAQDDELPRFRFFSDGRREDFHQKYLRIQGLFSEDFVGHLVFDSKRRK